MIGVKFGVGDSTPNFTLSAHGIGLTHKIVNLKKYKQVPAVADEPAQRAASQPTCCKQRWTLSVINLRLNFADSSCDSRRFQVMATYLAKVANLNLPHLCLLPPMGMISCEFCRDLQSQKTRVPGLSCSVICVILRLAFSVEHRLVTDRQTDTRLRQKTDRQHLLPVAYLSLIHI